MDTFTEDERLKYQKTLRDHAAFMGEAFERPYYDLLSTIESSQSVEGIKKFIATNHKIASMQLGNTARNGDPYMNIENAAIIVAIWNAAQYYMMRFQ